MALNALILPPKVALSFDDVLVQLHTDNYKTSDGTIAITHIQILLLPVENEYVRFTWNGTTYTWTAKASPGDTAFEFDIKTSVIEQTTELINALEATLQFDNDFYITQISGDSFDITARQAGADYSIAFTYFYNIWIQESPAATVGVDPAYRDFFYICLDIVNSADSRVGRLILKPDENNNATFNIMDFVNSLVEPTFEFPEDFDECIVARPEVCVLYTMKYFEQFGNPPEYQKIVRSGNYYALSGGLSFYKEAELNELDIHFWDWVQTLQKFLTFQPNDKKIAWAQIEKLFFLTYTNTTHLFLVVSVTLSDLSTVVIYKDAIAGVDQYQVYEFILTPDILFDHTFGMKNLEHTIDDSFAYTNVGGKLYISVSDSDSLYNNVAPLLARGYKCYITISGSSIEEYNIEHEITTITGGIGNSNITTDTSYVAEAETGDPVAVIKVEANLYYDIDEYEYEWALESIADDGGYISLVIDEDLSLIVETGDIIKFQSSTDEGNEDLYRIDHEVGTVTYSEVTGKTTILLTTEVASLEDSLINYSPDLVCFGSEGPGITSFEVYVEDPAGTRISEKKNYIIDSTYYKNIRYFLFRNSLGGYDSLRAVGVGSNESKYDRQVETKDLPANYTTRDREYEVKDVTETRVFKVNLGWLQNYGGITEDWLFYMRELMLSKDIFEIINGRIIPIVNETTKGPVISDENKLNDCEFTYRRAFVEKSHSEDEIPFVSDYNPEDYDEDDYWTNT